MKLDARTDRRPLLPPNSRVATLLTYLMLTEFRCGSKGRCKEVGAVAARQFHSGHLEERSDTSSAGNGPGDLWLVSGRPQGMAGID